MPGLSVISGSSRAEKATLREAPVFAGLQVKQNEAGELWLCIVLPRLAIDALHSEPSEPAVVVKRKAGRVEVLDCNRAARREGIRPAMPLAAAWSLRQNLNVYHQDSAAGRRILTRLADWSLAFSDRVALYTDHSVVLGIQGSLRLFGGLESLLKKAIRGLDGFGCEYAVAVAPAPRAALWLAQNGRGQVVLNPCELVSALRGLPVSKVARNDRHLARMQYSGLGTLGDLMRLPRVGVARRFGAQTLEMLDSALAKRPETVNVYRPPAAFSGERTFYLPTCDLNLIKPAAQALLEELEKYLAERGMATRWFHCVLMRDSKPVARIAVGCRRPACRAIHMRLLLDEHLHAVRIDVEVTSVVIACSALEPRIALQGDLFQTTTADGRTWSGLIEQLEARLGKGALKRLSVCADHRPERASWLADSGPGRQETQNGSARPLWLLEPPEPVGLRCGKPCWRGPLNRLTPCERIEQGWWDGFDISRDYWIAENSAGSRLWIYRDRRCGGWFLHGVFA